MVFDAFKFFGKFLDFLWHEKWNLMGNEIIGSVSTLLRVCNDFFAFKHWQRFGYVP